MGDYCDGILFKQHPLYSIESHALQIILYYDELELYNPLGTSAKIHKIGKLDVNKCVPNITLLYYRGILLSVGNLSPKFRSSLNSIHLISIAKSSVIQKYGPDKILQPFMADIKELEKVI